VNVAPEDLPGSQSDSAGTSAKNSSEKPQSDLARTSAKNSSEKPQSDLARTSAKNSSGKPQSDLARTSPKNSSGKPQPESAQTSAKNSSGNRQSDLARTSPKNSSGKPQPESAQTSAKNSSGNRQPESAGTSPGNSASNTVTGYLPEPETPREKARAARIARQSRAGGAALESFFSKRRPNAAFYDTAAVLAFEHEHPDATGTKEDLIKKTFQCTPARYYQRLDHLIHDDEESSRRIDAFTVNRLLNLEAERTEIRRQRLRGMTP
jgi:hypothetical protein